MFPLPQVLLALLFHELVRGIAIWPLPQEIQSGTSEIWLSPHLTFSLKYAPKEISKCYAYFGEQYILRSVVPLSDLGTG